MAFGSFTHSFRAGRRPAVNLEDALSMTTTGLGGPISLGVNSGSSTPGLLYHSKTEFYANEFSGNWAWDKWDNPSSSADYSGLSFAFPNGTYMPGKIVDPYVQPSAWIMVYDIDITVGGFTYPTITADTRWRSTESQPTAGATTTSSNHVYFAMEGQFAPSNSIDFTDFGNLGQTEAFPGTITQVEFTIKDTSSDATDWNAAWEHKETRFRVTRGDRLTSEDRNRRNSGSVTGDIDAWTITVEYLGTV